MTCAPGKLHGRAAGRAAGNRADGAPDELLRVALKRAQGAVPPDGRNAGGEGRAGRSR